MRNLVSLATAALVGCAEHKPNSIELAKACINSEVREGQKVSAERARQVVSHCSVQLDAWSRDSIALSLKRPFDPTDRQMTDAFAKHREANQKYWLRELSEEGSQAPHQVRGDEAGLNNQ